MKGKFFVKTKKNSLKCLLFHRLVDTDHFHRVLCAIESIINENHIMKVNEDNNQIFKKPFLFLLNNNLFSSLSLESEDNCEIPHNYDIPKDLRKCIFSKQITDIFCIKFHCKY